MFDEQFYPTTAETVDMMVAPYLNKRALEMFGKCSLHFKSVLEPEAGKGNIVDHLVEKYGVEKKHIRCIELHDELRPILASKGYKVVGTDFLKFDEPLYFDFIMMNPPFRQGIRHLLRAWEIASPGCHICCVLNAENLRTLHTVERQLVRNLIDQYGVHGGAEEIGRVFTDAERMTSVECVIVRLQKPDLDSSVNFADLDLDRDAYLNDLEHSENPLASADLLGALVAQYEGAKNTLVEIYQGKAKYRFYTKGIVSTIDDESASLSLNDEVEALKARFWRYIFDKTKIAGKATSQVDKKFQQFMAETSNLAFTIDNIGKILDMLAMNSQALLRECIVQVFDKATSYHADNKIHHEGWKTNKSWRMNHKLIVPRGITCEERYGWTRWNTYYADMDFYRDLDKAVCFVARKPYEQIRSTDKAIRDRCDKLGGKGRGKPHTDKFESEFFEIRIFKKGTVHLSFKDKELCHRFNAIAAEGRNWVGDGS